MFTQQEIELAGRMRDPATNLEQYNSYRIKIGNKIRFIEEPHTALGTLQKKLLRLFEYFELHPACMSRSGHGIASNAAPHHGSNVIYKADIKDFYRNTDYQTVEHSLLNGWSKYADRFAPLTLEEVVTSCMYFDVYRQEFMLPTGASTSPILSNLAGYNMDSALEDWATEHSYTYTRYFDDLTFSSMDVEPDYVFSRKVGDTVRAYGYQLNKKKCMWVAPGTNKAFEVTGVKLQTKESKSKIPRWVKKYARSGIEFAAKHGEGCLDIKTRGYLSYIKSIDEVVYNELLAYYEYRISKYNVAG